MPKKQQQVELFIQELQRYNKTHNILGRQKRSDILKEDVADTLLFLDQFNPNTTILDIGSGAGIPGIILAIYLPGSHIYMADKNPKKTHFIKKTTKKLGLTNTTTIHTNVNHKNQLGCYDVITARALGPTNKIINMAEHLLKKQGRFLLYKGSIKTINSEIQKVDKNKYNIKVITPQQTTEKQRHIIKATKTPLCA